MAQIHELDSHGNKLTASDYFVMDDGTVTSKLPATEIAALKITKTGISTLPQTISNSKITENHCVMNSVLSNPSAQTGDWTVTTSNGSLTIAGTISGSTDITLYLMQTL